MSTSHNEEIDQELFQRIRRFVEIQTNATPEEISADTRLAHDLGVAGDDGDELLIAFQKEFQVDPRGKIPRCARNDKRAEE